MIICLTFEYFMNDRIYKTGTYIRNVRNFDEFNLEKMTIF